MTAMLQRYTFAMPLGDQAVRRPGLRAALPAVVALLFGGFYALWRCARGEWRPRGYLLAGALAGLAVVAEYTAAMGVVGEDSRPAPLAS